MERLDYRITDFQTPLLQNINDLQNSSEYTNHIHRSIDTLRSLTDRATLNVTLAAQQNTNTTPTTPTCDPRGSNSPSLDHGSANARLMDPNQRISPSDRLSERLLLDQHRNADRLLDHHRLLATQHGRLSPDLDPNDRVNENHQRIASQPDQRFLNSLDFQTNQATREYRQHRSNESDLNQSDGYQERGNQRILNLHQTSGDYNDHHQRIEYNSRSRINESLDFSNVHNIIKSEFSTQRTPNETATRFSNENEYALVSRCNGNDDPGSYRAHQRPETGSGTASAGSVSGGNASLENRVNLAAGGPSGNKSCTGPLGDGASYSNSSPSSPGTPISIEGSSNYNNSQGQHDEEKVFGSKADLQLHTQMHMREAKPYKCTQCCKAFANSSYLSQHTRIHLGIKPYRCEICQRKFTQLSHLQQHIRTHTGDKPYKCRHPGCQKAFSQLSNLQSHSRCHQTDKPYKCNSCYKCFSDEPSLLEHIPKHKESKHLKTHICQYCGKSYTQETYLQKHMQKHSERVDKRPPITGAGGPLTGLNRNLLAAVSAAGVASLESPYWSKLSPDTMSSLDLERLEYHNHHSSSLAASNAAALLLERTNPGSNLGLLDRSNANVQNLHLEHRNSNYGPNSRQNSDTNQTFNSRQNNDGTNNENIPESNNAPNRTSFDGSAMKTNPDRNSSNPGSQHNNHDNIGEDLVVSNRHCRVNSPPNENSNLGGNGSAPNGNSYDTNKSGYEISISRSVTNSAFTPISGMNHLSLNHPMNRPYLYDALSFQNKDLNLNLNKSASNSNTFPNQLISLHQIRNYAHQPSSIGSGEHILGLKDK